MSTEFIAYPGQGYAVSQEPGLPQQAESPFTHLWSTPPTRAFQYALSSTPRRCDTSLGCGLRKACDGLCSFPEAL